MEQEIKTSGIDRFLRKYKVNGDTKITLSLLIELLYKWHNEFISTPPEQNTPQIAFKEMLTNLFDTSFLTPDELQTIADAGEMYAKGVVRNQPTQTAAYWSKNRRNGDTLQNK